MRLKELFFPSGEPSRGWLRTSRGILLGQGALAQVMFALGTGNFLAGYLSYLGASPALAAQIAAIPTLGCVLQMVAPFLFERLRHRKLAIVLLCFAFRFSMGFSVFAPFLFPSHTAQLQFVFVLYLFSFLAAGFVTPALNQWTLQLAPTGGRGRYFAVKDIVAAVANAVVAFVMARQLDMFTARGQALTGYIVVYSFCIVFAVVDAVLMSAMYEPPSTPAQTMRPAEVLAPLKSRRYRPVLVYNILSYFANYFSGSFLSIYQLTVLGLSHTFITTVGIVSTVVGMAAIWVWGRVADKTYWNVVVLCTGGISAACHLGWFLLTPAAAPFVAPVLMAVNAAGGGASGMAGLNLQFDACPPSGKTTYLGVTAAVASLVGYGAALLASFLQQALQPGLGARSIPVLFLGSALCGAVTLAYGIRRLPRQKPAEA